MFIANKMISFAGIQALECMLYTIDWVNNQEGFLPGITIGSYVNDDCDSDTYGLGKEGARRFADIYLSSLTFPTRFHRASRGLHQG